MVFPPFRETKKTVPPFHAVSLENFREYVIIGTGNLWNFSDRTVNRYGESNYDLRDDLLRKEYVCQKDPGGAKCSDSFD